VFLILVFLILVFLTLVFLTLVFLILVFLILILLTPVFILILIFINYKIRFYTLGDKYIISIINKDLIKLDLRENIIIFIDNIINSLKILKLFLS
jgi:hypothetical protein